MDLERIKKQRVGVLLQFAIPSIIAMVLTSLITFADGFFIGNYVGAEGMAAVNLGLPIVYLYLALGLMLAVGSAAIAGMALGSGDIAYCNEVFNQTIATTAVVTGLVSIVVFFCFEPMLLILHADSQVAGYFRDYYYIMLLELPVMVINSSFGMFIRGEGNPQFFMKINIGNVLLNVLLDYLFAGRFDFGVTGVAMASLIAALVTLVCSIFYFIKKSKIYHFHRFTFNKEVFRSTILNGSSEFIGEISMSISMFAYNFVIMRYAGVDGVTAFTLVGYVSYLFSMIVIGFGQGASPLISFTYGAKEKELAKEIRKTTNKFVFVIGGIVMLVMLLGAGAYSSFFVKNDVVKEMVQNGMRIFMLSFLFSGVNVITSFYFTSIGKAKESAIISSSRGLVLLLICIFILPIWFGMNGIWMAAPFTEGVTLLLSMFFLYQEKENCLVLKEE
ncbi:MAG: MATE family efflux transporter [Lachnospiraceae bacterium]|nr:MATE family efflux transporter [Lachnospiraceae bacterium]MDY4839450.1 MATE family efflux transporter [Lachnospiraceae bacterium]